MISKFKPIKSKQSFCSPNEIIPFLEKELTRIVGAETKHHVAIVGHSDGILQRGQVVLSVQQTTAIEVERVLQIDLLHVGVRRASNTDHVVCVAMQMERMAQIRLLN